jgi:hypothetical protein
LKRDVVAEDQKSMDCKTGTVYKGENGVSPWHGTKTPARLTRTISKNIYDEELVYGFNNENRDSGGVEKPLSPFLKPVPVKKNRPQNRGESSSYLFGRQRGIRLVRLSQNRRALACAGGIRSVRT